MFLIAVVYSKVTEMKLVLYESDPNNARIIMKYNTFHSMNPIYGRERENCPNQPCTTMQQFPFKCQMQTIIYQRTISMCLFQILQQL
jgi:hypothetical protein